ncbi:restriction endonuclease subunit S [Candidatus Acetothermia bacterium]|jgi:type I restriction enzyme S subunit|nr:restriction endonuclease subunit S [Candidatus Acetothermia bacterium]
MKLKSLEKSPDTKEIEGQHELPPAWRRVRLGEVCEVNSNQVLPNTAHAKQLPYIGLEHIESGTGRIIDKVNDTDGKLIQSTTFRFDSQHVLYGKLRPYLNKVAIPDFQGRCTTELLPLFPLDRCDRFYLAWLLRRAETVEEAMRHKTGTRMPRADVHELFKMLVPLPPIFEQKRIAAKIQELMQEVDRARTACEKQLEAAKALPAAYLRQVFESEEAKKWERKRLGEVCEVSSGLSAPQEQKYFENGKYPFVRVQDLGRYGKTNNLVDIKDDVNDVAIVELKLKKAEKGTILFPKSGAAITTNNRAILGIDAFIVSHLAAIKPKEGIADAHFVYNWLCLTDMVQYMENPGYPSLKLSAISKISIPLPSLDIQQRLAAELKEKMAEVEKLRTAIEKQLEAINALPQAILIKAFRGEL